MSANAMAISRAAVSQSAWIGKWLVLAAALFNLVLCFVETRGVLRVNNAEIAVVEIAIMAAGLIVIRDDIDRSALLLIGLALGYIVGAKLVNPLVSVKILHDIGIMYIFYLVGRAGGVAQAELAMRLTLAVVMIFAVFEAVLPTLFGVVFNVWDYYVQKGVITADTVNYSGTNLYLSGNRGGSASRAFFPGLFGAHRISSVFLEPDSLGNFAATIFAWGLSTFHNAPGRRRVLVLFFGVTCFVLADSRFASGCCMIMLLLRLSPMRGSPLVAFFLPIMVCMALTLAGSLAEIPGVLPAILTDDFKGRLLFSGRLLDYWHVPQWFALAPSQVYTADTGYAYTLNNIGLPITLLFLAIFAFRPAATREAAMMRTSLSVYFATSLCIGASVFTIKTAALAWLLYGALNRVPVRARMVLPNVQPRMANSPVPAPVI